LPSGFALGQDVVTGHRLGTILASPPMFRPAYLALLASGVLDDRADTAWTHLRSCDLCARYCRVNRSEGIEGAVCWSARIGRSP
jgi:uncharacterized Fe-S radical SAM superfamily protein PflX